MAKRQVLINLFTNASAEERPLNNLAQPATLCDVGEKEVKSRSVRVVKRIPLQNLTAMHGAYQNQVTNLPAQADDFKNKAIFSANIPASDIRKILRQNSGNKLFFLRIYVCADGAGDHVVIVGPADIKKKLIQRPGTYFSEQCCGYPPHTANFKDDPIINKG